MYCAMCGEQLPDEIKFCPMCGAKAIILNNDCKNKESVKVIEETNSRISTLVCEKDEQAVELDAVPDDTQEEHKPADEPLIENTEGITDTSAEESSECLCETEAKADSVSENEEDITVTVPDAETLIDDNKDEESCVIKEAVSEPKKYSSDVCDEPVTAADEAPKTVLIDPRYKPLSVGGYIGMFVLSAIPIINIILILVWAISGNTNYNRKSYARAIILMTLVILALSLGSVAVLLLLGHNLPVLDNIKYLNDSVIEFFDNLKYLFK